MHDVGPFLLPGQGVAELLGSQGGSPLKSRARHPYLSNICPVSLAALAMPQPEIVRQARRPITILITSAGFIYDVAVSLKRKTPLCKSGAVLPGGPRVLLRALDPDAPSLQSASVVDEDVALDAPHGASTRSASACFANLAIVARGPRRRAILRGARRAPRSI